jgi:protein TonB
MQRGLEFPTPTVDRRFCSILLLSVAIHAGVLAWQRGTVDGLQPELPPLVATLRAIAEAPLTPSEPVAAPLPAAVPQKARQQPARTEFQSAPHLTSSAGPANSAAQAPALASPAEAPAAQQAIPVVAVQAASAVRSPEELLADYRRRLTELFARQQEYPRLAAMRGWEGEVRVRVRVARKGNLLGVALDHSSGYEVLDKHALGMVGELGGLPSLPDDYGANELQVVVPVNYRLREAT